VTADGSYHAPVNRAEFREIALVRLSEAKLLLDAALFDGAYYLSGYAVACASKAVIARQTRRHDFPPKVADVRDMYTHDLSRLVKLANLDANRLARSVFDQNWATVKDWSEESRYARWDEPHAASLYGAVADPRHGVLRWLRKHW
jgi:hypothetical protein